MISIQKLRMDGAIYRWISSHQHKHGMHGLRSFIIIVVAFLFHFIHVCTKVSLAHHPRRHFLRGGRGADIPRRNVKNGWPSIIGINLPTFRSETQSRWTGALAIPRDSTAGVCVCVRVKGLREGKRKPARKAAECTKSPHHTRGTIQ